MGAQAAVLILRYYLAFLRAFCCQFLNAALIPPLAESDRRPLTILYELNHILHISSDFRQQDFPHCQADCIRYPFRCVLGCKAIFYNPLERLLIKPRPAAYRFFCQALFLHDFHNPFTVQSHTVSILSRHSAVTITVLFFVYYFVRFTPKISDMAAGA